MLHSILLSTAFLPVASAHGAEQEAGSAVAPIEAFALDTQVVIFDVSDLTDADELENLRRAIVREDLEDEMRAELLDEYVSMLESGEVEGATQSIVTSIETFIEPQPGPEFRIAPVGPGRLAVAGSPAQQVWVKEFLRSMRGFDGLIDIQMHMYQLPQGHLETLLGGWSGKALDAMQLTELLEDLDRIEDKQVVAAPRVMVFPAGRASISTIEQTAYIKDFELTILPDLNKEIADPTIDVLQTGVVVDVLAVPVGDDRLAVLADFAYSTAEKPFPTRSFRLGAHTEEVTIQVPEVRTAKANARFELGPNEAVALAAADPGDGSGERLDGDDAKAPRDMLVILRARRMIEPK